MRFLILFFFLTPFFAQAQFFPNDPCVDSSRINPFYQCNDPAFIPVCGCNNVTYRNECEMTNVGGVNRASQFENGVCRNDFFFFTISPIPALDKLDFNMLFAERQQGPVTIQIFDIFGNVVYSQLLNGITDRQSPPQTIRLSDMETGVYIFMVQSQGIFKFKKFVKHTL